LPALLPARKKAAKFWISPLFCDENRFVRDLPERCLRLLDIVAADDFLVTQVQTSVADDRMCPDSTLWISLLGLWIQSESTVFGVTFGCG
jgi:hypothetical protein